jgi:hypothetical protein
VGTFILKFSISRSATCNHYVYNSSQIILRPILCHFVISLQGYAYRQSPITTHAVRTTLLTRYFMHLPDLPHTKMLMSHCLLQTGVELPKFNGTVIGLHTFLAQNTHSICRCLSQIQSKTCKGCFSRTITASIKPRTVAKFKHLWSIQTAD